jgi:hypothetical protein
MNMKQMKKIKYISLAAIIATVGVMMSCSEDFINVLPQDQFFDENFYKSDAELLAGSAPLYNVVWFAYNDKASHGIGDGRGGVFSSNYSYQLENIQFRTTGVTDENAQSWRAFFNVVGQANALLRNISLHAGPAVTPAIKNHAIAEARLMRGMAYMYLVQNWKEVPIITDNIALLNDTTVRKNTRESIWEFITRDIRYGITNLPEEPVQVGRLTKYAAEGLLAKVYLTRAGLNASIGNRNQEFLDSARILAKDVIDNSGRTLMPNYEDLFKTKFNNNQETLFALQWVYNGAWGTNNSTQAYLAFSSAITGTPDGWGGDLGASIYQLDQYEGLTTNNKTDDVRRKATFMFPGDHYSYIHQQVLDGAGNPVIQELTVPTNGSYNSRAWVKKYVVGRPEDNEGKVQQQRTEMQTYMLRLAEVYLIYAEAILGNNASTNDGDALEYFNAVRERAGLGDVASITLDDIYHERRCEFAMEGQAWYDWVRYSYFNEEDVYAQLSSQDRGFTRIVPIAVPEGEDPQWDVIPDPDGPAERTFTVNEGNFYLPIPESELSRAPSLRHPAVDYTF